MLRKMLVALDLSPQALAICQVAVEVARGLGAELTALHVAVPRLRSSLDLSAAAALEAEAAARLNGEQILEEARALAGDLGTFRTELHFGDPVDQICTRADELGVDLILLGSRGLHPVEQLLLGSVGAGVARRARCSILLVRSTSLASSDAAVSGGPESLEQVVG